MVADKGYAVSVSENMILVHKELLAGRFYLKCFIGYYEEHAYLIFSLYIMVNFLYIFCFLFIKQHFDAAEVGKLARCLCIPLVSIRVGKIIKQGTLLCPTATR